MSFLNLRTKQITITRLTLVTGTTNRYAYTATVTVDYANIQPQDDDKELVSEGAVGKLYKMYVDEALDIQDGDRIRDEDSRLYNVIAGGVNDNYDFGVMVQHREVFVRRVTND